MLGLLREIGSAESGRGGAEASVAAVAVGESCVEVALAWFKSSYSDGPDGETCLEIAPTPTTIHIRDSTYTHTPATPGGPQLALAPSAWSAFLPYASAH
ncbi:DUF397 domain-containing protein [Streptomyces sp. NPDC001714]|uniref:DUF397 domain-containing protein n=1 Tax=Streptomyces sp. NPDC001714 TaxID=3364603 RepID=UPI00368BAF9E